MIWNVLLPTLGYSDSMKTDAEMTTAVRSLNQAFAKLAELIVADCRQRVAEIIEKAEAACPQPSPFPSRLVSKKELAAHCEVSLRTIDLWCQRKIVPYFNIGKTVRFKIEDVEEQPRMTREIKARTYW